ncbi:UDP-N-acetylglucosamine 1-carboxyvinyltransferase [Pseudothermotoga sp.]|uniref:UDP-N-acetylglucosamine 1-carboxyvinyltransferase n=1 Tax=Pseudothermotoga sp. TaxID=2033661 RepID=UPI00258E73BC|nr:UDP-N-acetylglucosamine 1-carboxyvinyltransferase [Pseudothermotoga sp.]MDK2884780.1 UDP-N-acetylglucosamine 1-carboxyvinyltransferase [Pseudothermotoga sp.]
MGKLIIEGPARLNGAVKISGSKNAALPIIAASLICDRGVLLENVPDLMDVRTMIDILNSAGCKTRFAENVLSVNPPEKPNTDIPYELVRKMRASFNVLGPLAAKYGKASVSLPGGCSIGVRPVDYHIEGLQKLGFSINIEHGIVTAELGERPQEVLISLPFPSVGATEHIMTTAAILNGTHTILENAAMEPEIEDLANFLNDMGCKVFGAGTRRIEIFGVEKTRECTHRIIPDRIEAGTYAIAVAATMGDAVIENLQVSHLVALFDVLRSAGVEIQQIDETAIRIKMNQRPQPVKVQITPYPGYPTDLQPQIITFLSIATGTSTVSETVFKSRFQHVDELRRLGAKIEVNDGTAIIYGVENLSGAQVNATDLRAAAALVIAGLMASGTTSINEVDQIFRGYENIVEKLSRLSAVVEYFE